MKSWEIPWNLLGLRLVQLLGVSSGTRVLDVGTGIGSTLLASLQCVGPTGYVVSLDTDQERASYLSNELGKLNVLNSEVRLLNPEHIDVPHNYFDFVVSGFFGWDYCFDFATNRFHSPDSIMKEIHRTLKPNGRLGISSWLLQSDMDLMEECLGQISDKKLRSYSRESEEGWQTIMKNSQFDDFVLLPEVFTDNYPSLEIWWSEMARRGWKRSLLSLSKEMGISVEDIKMRAFEEVRRYCIPNGVPLTRKVLFIIATKN
jgi:ubiquinone/menaquinone biosynthesis C-methylase UbiE